MSLEQDAKVAFATETACLLIPLLTAQKTDLGRDPFRTLTGLRIEGGRTDEWLTMEARALRSWSMLTLFAPGRGAFELLADALEQCATIWEEPLILPQAAAIREGLSAP